METSKNEKISFRALIANAIDMGVASRKQIAMAADCDEETIRRWLTGQRPRYDHFRNLHSSRSKLSPAFQIQIVDYYHQNGQFRATYEGKASATELDVNRDGKVDGADVEAFTLKVMAEAVSAMQLRRTRWESQTPTEEQKAEDRASLHSIIRMGQMALAALDYEANDVRMKLRA